MKKIINGILVLSVLIMVVLAGCSMDEQMSTGSTNDSQEHTPTYTEDDGAGSCPGLNEALTDGEQPLVNVVSMDLESKSSVPIDVDDTNGRIGARPYSIHVYKGAHKTGPKKGYYSSKQTMHDLWSDGTKVTDSISSLFVRPGYQVVVYRYTLFRGEYLVLGANSSPTAYWDLTKLTFKNNSSMTVDNRISSIEIKKVKKVANVTYKRKNPNNSEGGSELHVESIQGIAHSSNYWYLSRNRKIYRCHKNNMTDALGSTGTGDLPYEFLKEYDHYGDMDFYGDYLYVATTKKGRPPIVIVYDEMLRYQGYYRFPGDRQNDAAWVAINPMNGMLYSTDEYRKLKVYKMGDLRRSGTTLTYLYYVYLDFGSLGHKPGSWWNDVWNQGGDFDRFGNFYYTLDHSKEDKSIYTGVYIFDLVARKGYAKWRLNIKYDPDYDHTDWRYGEPEGITVWDRGNDSNYPGVVHQLFLTNEAREDDISVYHYDLDYK